MKLYLRLILAALSALLIPLCFPPYGFWPLIPVSLLMLLLATADVSPRKAFYIGMLHGILGYGLTLYWLFHIFSTVAIPLYAILALFVALFCLFFNIISKQIKSPVLKVFIAATIWTAFEFFRCEIFILRFPWITPGTAFGPTWLSPVLGVYGASFLIMTATAAFMFRKTIALAIVLSGIILCLGIFRPGVVVAPTDNSGLTLAVIQSEACALYSYIDLTKTIADKSPDLIIWPECALPYDVRKKPHRFEELMKFSADMNSIFVIGTQTQLENIDEDWYNTALTLDRNGVIGEYYKNRPVHLFNDGTAGTNLNPIVTEIGNFATPICFDCDYSTVSRKMTKLGAEFFAVPSFDSYFWGKTQHLQHSMFFRLRAAENSRWLACAASSGVSQIIDPHGNVHKCIPALETGAITGRIGKENHLNFYVRIGWLFPWITIGCSAIFLLWSLKNKSFNCISKRQP